jgi:Peptidase M15
MATIPQIVTSPGAVPSAPTGGLGGGQVRASPQMDIPSPGDPSQAQAAGATMASQAYESEAHSAEKLAKYGEEFADQYIKAKLNIDAANRTADLSAQLHEAEFQSSKIADRDAATADFDARAGKIRDNFAAQDVNPRVRAAVDANLPNQIALRRASTQQAAFGLWSQAQVGQLVTNLDQYNKQAVDAQDPRLTEQLINQANQAIDGRVEGGALHADVAAKMKVDFGSNVYRTKVEVVMQKDMAAGVALYNQYRAQGKFNAADGRAMAVVAADRTKQLDADQYVTQNMPGGPAGGGGGGNVGAVHADAEKTLGFALPVTSADRSEAHNREVGGATGSQHLTPGSAQDISLAGLTDEQKTKVYNQFLSDPRVGGIGFYADHLHIDTRSGQKATWGTPPAGIADQLKTWQATPTAAPAPKQAEEDRIAGLKFIQGIQNDLTIDPEKRARIIATATQRLGTQQAIQAAQTAQVKDQEEQVAVASATGKYKDGDWKGLADAFGRVGDFGKRDAYQSMADNESMFKNFATASPDEQRRMADFLPGVAGKIARAVMAEGREDRAVIRADAQRSEEEARKLIANPEADAAAGAKVAADAIRGYLQAGTPRDIAKAEAIRESLSGMIEGKIKGGQPADEAQAELARIQERFRNGGFTNAEAAQANILRTQMQHTETLRRTDPQQLGTPALGPLAPFPFQGSPDDQAKAMQTRVDRARWIDGKYFPGAGQPITPVFTAQEIAQEVQVLKTGSVQNRQTEAKKLATMLPREQITILAKHIAGDGADGLSSAIAEAIPKYASGDQQEIAIADSIIRGANRLYESGEATKVRMDPTLSQTLTNLLAPARIAGQWDGRDVKRQDHAVMSRYVDSMGARDLAFPDTDVLTTAIKDVVGEPYSSRAHGDVLLPKGVTSTNFNDAVSLLSPAEVPPLQPARDGRAITFQMAKDQGITATVGNGVYKLRFKDPSDGIVRDLKKQDGTPVIIDMKPLFTRAQKGEAAPAVPSVSP